MPVALSEWRVRIGTFIHRIKEWVVREMREELLKERIQRLRVLWKRLKAKKDDSNGGSQDNKPRQDEVDSCDSSLVNQQGDAEPSTKTGQDSPQPCCVGSDTLHHEPSGQTVTSQTDSASLSTPTHPTSGVCLSRPFLSSFLSPSFYFCFPVIFLLFSSLLLPLSPGFGIPVSVSLPFLVVFLFLLSLFLSTFLPFSRRERSFGECHTSTASPSKYGSGTNEAVDEQLPRQPNLQELMLVTAGDVELNPGPHEGTLQEKELVLLAKEVPGNVYDELCIGLGFSYTEGQNVLTKRLLDIPGALIELFCRWKIRQRDGTDCRAVLGGILKDTNMGSLQKRLLEGEYLKSETEENVPNKGTTEQAMTEEQVSRCAEELKLFYRERMCKIKPDPLAFDLIYEFEEIYTNLTLLRNEMGITKKKGSLEYKDLLTTKINGVPPKRLLVEGEGGVGKTTLCSKIAWDWTNGSEAYNHFIWVLVVPLRNVIKGESIGDIMKNYLHNNNNVSPEQIANYMNSHPSEILIILDGFDEYNGDLSTDDTSGISQILRLKMLEQCTVLVTTRPWRADQIKCNQELSRCYCFIAVEGFSTKNVSKYITKFFAKDKKSGIDLRQFIQGNDVIKENMAPFPIYVAMLCVLWKDIGVEKREIIRKLKTFSQLFEQMIIFLQDHYLSKLKNSNTLNEEQLKNELKAAEKCLQQIGSVAFQGLLEKKLVFKVDDFSSCKDAMTTSCRIGILSKEQEHVPRHKRSIRDSQAVTASVFFPHKLFQEYVAALYLASVYESDLQKYNGLTERLLEENPQEFRFLLYFTAAQLKEAGLDIVDRLHHLYSGNKKSKRQKTDIAFLVDVTFEAYHEDAAKRVGQWLDAENRALTINKELSAHTMSGCLFINEHHGVKTLEVRKTKLDSSTSLVIANAVLSSSSLTTLKLLETNLHDNFYKFILDHISKDGTTTSNVQLLCTGHRLIGKLHNFGTRIELVFPLLKKMSVSTLQTISPVIVQTLAHANLKELSIERGEEDTRGLRSLNSNLIPLIGEPDLLGRLFSDSFPQLTSIVFKELMMGNKRTESILRNLRKHQHLKTISIIDCFTDDELDTLAEEIDAENRMKITLQHKEGQRRLDVKLSTDLLDALCNRTSVCELTLSGLGEDDLCFPDLHDKEVDSKIHTVEVYNLDLANRQSESCCLGRVLSLLPRLTDLTINYCNFHDNFFREIAARACSSQDGTTTSNVQLLCTDHRLIGKLHNFGTRIELVFPMLKKMSVSTLQTTSPVIVQTLAHANLKELSIERGEEDTRGLRSLDSNLIPLIGEPDLLGRLFSDPFPQLTSLVFIKLMMGNKRTESILRNLRKHQHLKTVGIIDCFTDDELDPLAEEINAENRMKITLQHNEGQRRLHVKRLSTDLLDALCNRTSVCELTLTGLEEDDLCFPEIHGEEVDSKIHTVKFERLYLFNQQSGSCCLGRFLSFLPRLTDLTIYSCSFHDDFYREITERASSSQIHTVKFERLILFNQQSGSCCLGRFLSLLPRLTDLTIMDSYFHDDFYREISERASSSQIRTLNLDPMPPSPSPSSWKHLARFICCLPCLTTLTIGCIEDLGDFFIEFASMAASSKIHTLVLQFRRVLQEPPSSSACKHLPRFICCLPRLTKLMITNIYHLRDDFFTEFPSMAASSKIHTLVLGFQRVRHRPLTSSACKHLARFICCLPRLTTLKIACIEELRDDFFIDFASMAASSKIHTLVIDSRRDRSGPLSSSACKHLARFICCLPRLTTLTTECIDLLHDDFFIDFASMAASSKSPYFMERKHIHLLDEHWPRWREFQSPTESSSSAASTNHSEVEPSQHQGPPTGLTNLPHHQLQVATLSDSSIGIHSDSGSMNPSTTYPHRAHTESIRSTSEQVDLTTRQHLDEFDRYLESYLAAQNFTHVPSHSLGHSSDSHTKQQYGSSVRTNTPVLKRQEQPTQMEPNTLLPSSSSYINSLMFMHGRGSSIGRKPLFEHDEDHCMPSTSGIASLQRAHPADTDPISNILESRDDIGDDEDTTAGSVERYRYPLHSHSKRIHSESSDDTRDDEESTAESVDLVDARPRKRRAKTDRNPTSP